VRLWHCFFEYSGHAVLLVPALLVMNHHHLLRCDDGLCLDVCRKSIVHLCTSNDSGHTPLVAAVKLGHERWIPLVLTVTMECGTYCVVAAVAAVTKCVVAIEG